MASQRQIDANRRNAQKSTGPKTPEGRAAIRFNALRHGLTARNAVLCNEDEKEFQELLAAWDLEKSMKENYVDFDEHHRHGYVFLSDVNGVNALKTFSTYAARAERSFYKALHELERVRARRAGDPVPPPAAIDVDVSIPENNNLEVPVEAAPAPTDNLNKQSQSQNRTLPAAGDRNHGQPNSHTPNQAAGLAIGPLLLDPLPLGAGH